MGFGLNVRLGLGDPLVEGIGKEESGIGLVKIGLGLEDILKTEGEGNGENEDKGEGDGKTLD